MDHAVSDMSRRIDRRVADKRIGRPTRLTQETADRIVGTVADGNHITTACASAGVSRAALYSWLERGENARQAAEAGDPVDADEVRFLDFLDRLALARARAEMCAVEVIQRGMAGGFVISEEPLLDVDRQPVRDDNGEILWKRQYAQPDGRLALAYLARSRPDLWGQNPTARLGLTGSGGGPVQVEHDHFSALAERLSLVAAERRAEDEDRGICVAEPTE
jgi:hypothetical protein